MSAVFQSDDGARQNGGIGEVEFVGGTMNGVDFDGGGNIEARLFESEAHASGSGK